MRKEFIAFIIFIAIAGGLQAQTELDDRASLSFKKGWGFVSHDSSVIMNMRFRVQSRFGFLTESSNDLSIASTEAKVRRIRLRFDGYVAHKKLSYLFQLGFSRDDLDWDKCGFPSIVRDAMIFVPVNKNLFLGFGQGKLPTNRQQMTSSGQQQFIDRSIVNSLFSPERDFGLFMTYSNSIGNFNYIIKTTISAGDGRNYSVKDDNFAYTARLELLPFGKFTNSGDYSEGDIEREENVKLSLSGGMSYNRGAMRTGGSKGDYLESSRDLVTAFADLLIKHKGWALSCEAMSRDTRQSCIANLADGSPSYIYNGFGINNQLSYLFKSNVEVAGRMTYVKPANELQSFEPAQYQYMLGVTKYLSGHPVKIQTNLMYLVEHSLNASVSNASSFGLMFQLELGI